MINGKLLTHLERINIKYILSGHLKRKYFFKVIFTCKKLKEIFIKFKGWSYTYDGADIA
jgi:hypothetical protein